MTREHKTLRGALLAGLEHRCVEAGRWWTVEGHEVFWIDGRWRVNGKFNREPALGVFTTFTEALEAIADHQEDPHP